VYLNGDFCSNHLNLNIKNKLNSSLKHHSGLLTRLDIALDFFKGEVSYLDSVKAYKSGLFMHEKASVSPFSKVIQELSDTNSGNSHYVGKRTSGKMYRAYEKGHQLGDKGSNWVRLEVEYNTNNNRFIDPDCLINHDQAFSESYPYCSFVLSEFCSEFVSTGGKLVKVVRDEKIKVQVQVLIAHARNSYGKLFDLLGQLVDESTGELFAPSRICKVLGREGIPDRLNSASFQGFQLQI
jgi:phage replication initiation protein